MYISSQKPKHGTTMARKLSPAWGLNFQFYKFQLTFACLTA